jgi:5'(3')-deoxyribonucleotidase
MVIKRLKIMAGCQNFIKNLTNHNSYYIVVTTIYRMHLVLDLGDTKGVPVK